MSLIIKPVETADLGQLRNLGIQTFTETFSEVNTPENMRLYLSKAFNLSGLVKEFNNPESEFYFAVYDDQVAGYLKINLGSAQTEKALENSLEVERIYVLNKFQGKRIGKALYEFAVEIASEKKCTSLWLGVWDRNDKAIEFYKRQGFEKFSEHDFHLGTDLQTDYLMKLELE